MHPGLLALQVPLFHRCGTRPQSPLAPSLQPPRVSWVPSVSSYSHPSPPAVTHTASIGPGPPHSTACNLWLPLYLYIRGSKCLASNQPPSPGHSTRTTSRSPFKAEPRISHYRHPARAPGGHGIGPPTILRATLAGQPPGCLPRQVGPS